MFVSFEATIRGGLPVEVEAEVTKWRDLGTYAKSEEFTEVTITDVRFPRRRGKQGARVKFALSASDGLNLEEKAIAEAA